MLDLKTPKGTTDFNPVQAATLEHICTKIRSIYVAHGAVPIATPTFELSAILTNKYGDDAKLIYNLEDQGGEPCSLRYDLTVPFSRFLVMNRIKKIRRFQIANVFRRDSPSIKTGRLREFTQADFDICGSNLPMVDEAEILLIVYQVLCSMQIKHKFTIRINDRRILNSLLNQCGIERNLHQTICSTIDKKDKMAVGELVSELISKGLDMDQIKLVEKLILSPVTDNASCIKFLRSISLSDESVVDEMEILLGYLDIYGVPVVIDLSLARGIDYYTGLILEAAYEGVDVGSVAGGGRYDGLCHGLSDGKLSVPCVGFSIGVSRIFALHPAVSVGGGVFVGSGFGLNLAERMAILKELWGRGVRAETFTGKRVNYGEQIDYAKKHEFKVGIFTGDEEKKKCVAAVVDLERMEKEEVGLDDVIDRVVEILNR